MDATWLCMAAVALAGAFGARQAARRAVARLSGVAWWPADRSPDDGANHHGTLVVVIAVVVIACVCLHASRDMLVGVGIGTALTVAVASWILGAGVSAGATDASGSATFDPAMGSDELLLDVMRAYPAARHLVQDLVEQIEVKPYSRTGTGHVDDGGGDSDSDSVHGVASHRSAVASSEAAGRAYDDCGAWLHVDAPLPVDHAAFGSGRRDAGGLFFNIGLWTGAADATGGSLAAAGARLTRVAAVVAGCEPSRRGGTDARSGSGQAVLDVGCGAGDGCALLAREFDVSRVYGVNLSAGQVDAAKRRLRAHGIAGDNVSIARGSATALAQLFARRRWPRVDVVLSIDSAYHYDTREAFFAHAWAVLNPGGRLGVVDVILDPTWLAGAGTMSRLWLRIVAMGAGMPMENLRVVSVDEYARQLEEAGFHDVRVHELPLQRTVGGLARYARERATRLAGVASPLVLAKLRAVAAGASAIAQRRVVRVILATASKAQ